MLLYKFVFVSGIQPDNSFTCFRINPKNFYSDLKYADLNLQIYCSMAEGSFTVAVLQGTGQWPISAHIQHFYLLRIFQLLCNPMCRRFQRRVPDTKIRLPQNRVNFFGLPVVSVTCGILDFGINKQGNLDFREFFSQFFQYVHISGMAVFQQDFESRYMICPEQE